MKPKVINTPDVDPGTINKMTKHSPKI